MYIDRFRLNHPPFEETTSPRCYHETAALRAIADAIRAYVAAGGGAVLVEGEAGSGRSVLGRALPAQMPDGVHTLALIAASAEGTSLLGRIIAALRLADTSGTAADSNVEKVMALLRKPADRRHVVIVDEAERLSPDDLFDIECLLGAARGASVQITVVLLATAAIHGRLKAPRLAKLTACMHRTARLARLDSDEVAAYLQTRLTAAGWRGDAIFTTAAAERIARLSGGRWREINHAAHQAMVRAACMGVDVIDAELIPDTDTDNACANLVASTSSNARSEHNMDARPNASPMDVERMERIVERFAELTASAPQRMAELDAALERMSERAESVLSRSRDAAEHLQRLCERVDHRDAAISGNLSRTERATGEAKLVQQRLEDFVRRLGDIDAGSEERIALLLSGLESAQIIHEKLEATGNQVTGLIEESRQAAEAERASLAQIFDELSTRRAELSGMIDGLRREQQAVLEENRGVIGAMIDRSRADAAQAGSAATEAQAEIRRLVDAGRAELAHQSDVANRRMKDTHAACAQIIEQVAQARTEERVAALREASAVAQALLVDTGAAADRLRDSLARSEQCAGSLARNIDAAAHLRDNVIVTLERIQSDGVHAIEQVARAAEDRIQAGVVRAESLVAVEQSARAAAEEALRSARSAVTTAQEAQSRLTEAQAAAIDIEATASAVMASVQQQLKRFEESVNATVAQGLDRARGELSAMLDTGVCRTREASVALESAVEAALARVNGEIESVRAELASANERDVDQAARAVRAACTNAVARTDDRAREILTVTEEELRRVGAELIAQANNTAERVCNELVAQAERAAVALRTEIDQHAQTISQTAENSATQARENIATSVAAAMQSVEIEIGAAEASAGRLATVMQETRELLEGAGAARERIDQQMRDVWTLTNTADQRVRDLGALIATAGDREAGLNELMANAARETHALADQVERARLGAETFAAQQGAAETITRQFAERIAEAQQICADMAQSNDRGLALAPQMTARMEEMQALLASAGDLIARLRGDAERARAQHDAVVQLSSMTVSLEGKVVELQEALAQPMTVMQEARAQADELNEVCLAVKRVFRGVSQASLQANERIKLLGKLLVATERSSRTMKQWVEEAGRAQARLADTVAQAPGIHDTHPLVALPELPSNPGGPLPQGANLAPADRATVQRFAGVGATQTVMVANTSAQLRPVVVPAGKEGATAKIVQPLVDVLRARGEKQKTSVAGGPRLRPEDVQAMIDIARQNAAAGQ